MSVLLKPQIMAALAAFVLGLGVGLLLPAWTVVGTALVVAASVGWAVVALRGRVAKTGAS